MSLEKRITETLHRVDDYQPSADLFTRVERSISGDLAHRRRMRWAVVAAVGMVAMLATYLALVVRVEPDGSWVMPWWAAELAATVIMVALLLGLGPLIRRFGAIYAADVFFLSPKTGARFLSLLDLAYYLFFAGWILDGVSLADVGETIAAVGGLTAVLERIAFFLAVMGLAHAANLLVLPVVGLVFNSTVRRARRASAGNEAPTLSPAAVRADRITTWIVLGLVGAIAAGALLLIGMAIGAGAG